ANVAMRAQTRFLISTEITSRPASLIFMCTALWVVTAWKLLQSVSSHLRLSRQRRHHFAFADNGDRAARSHYRCSKCCPRLHSATRPRHGEQAVVEPYH